MNPVMDHLNCQGQNLLSRRDKKKLIGVGYTYTLKDSYYSSLKDQWKCYWRCAKCSVGRASSSRLTQHGDDVDVTELVHTHDDQCGADYCTAINELARNHYLHLVSGGFNRTLAYNQTYQDLGDVNIVGARYLASEGRNWFPSQVSLATSARRSTVVVDPPNPDGIDDFHLNGDDRVQYTRTHDNRRFHLFTAAYNERKIIVFGTNAKIQLLVENHDKVHIDGTWKVVPRIINKRNGQLLILHCRFHGVCIPCIYAYLPNKSVECYTMLLNILSMRIHQIFGVEWDITRIMSDFEAALLIALRNSWPQLIFNGCLFHMSACVYRFIAEHPVLKLMYLNNVIYCKFVRVIVALAYLPPAMVVQAFDAICDAHHAAHPAQHQCAENVLFLQYFENTWLFNHTVSIQHWSVFQTDQVRTNNAVEGYHNRLHRVMGDHPNIWKAIRVLKDEDQHYDMIVEQLRNGQQVSVSKRKYVTLNNRLARLKHRFTHDQINALQYVDAVANLLMTPKWFTNNGNNNNNGHAGGAVGDSGSDNDSNDSNSDNDNNSDNSSYVDDGTSDVDEENEDGVDNDSVSSGNDSDSGTE